MPGCHKNILLILVLTLAMAVSQPFAAVNVYAEPSGSYGESVLEAPAQTAVPDAEEADNDELFEEYIERELQESLPSSGKRLLKAGKTKLSGTNLALYNVLKAQIEKVAAGKLSSTIFTVSLDDLGLPENGWTASELGVDHFSENGYVTAETTGAIYKIIGYDLNVLLNALAADCPYDLYWFDKTYGLSTKGPSFMMSGDSITITSGITFYFAVAEGYAVTEDDQYYLYEVDTSHGTRVSHAVSKAESIVADHASGSDFSRLVAYKEAICDLVEYDDYAAHSGVPYGDSWQLISVFDEDDSTNVVCEGYSKAFQYLCDLTAFSGDVSCISVSGIMSGGTGAGDHMWNIVNMEDGYNYLVDVTNCDEGTVGASDKLFLTGYSKYEDPAYIFLNGNLKYTYDDDTLSLYSDELQISDHNYVSEWDTPCVDGQEHSFGEWEHLSDSTCVRHGYESHTCTKCGLIKPRRLPLKDHDWGAGWVIKEPATYTERGLRERSCQVCGYTEKQRLEVLSRTSIANASVGNIKVKVYTGSAVTQNPVVKVGGKRLTNGTDYELTYSKNKYVGTATVKITGINAYRGSISRTFTIRPKPTVLRKVSPLRSGFTAKWNKRTAQTKGYQLQYCTRKSFSGSKVTVVIKNNTTISRKVTGLKAGKRYYVRVRTYKKVNGTNYYSAWSEAVPVTTKK